METTLAWDAELMFASYLELSATVDNIDGLLNSQVAPHRHLTNGKSQEHAAQIFATSISLERLDTTSMGELFSEWTINSLEEKGATFLCGP